MKHTDTELAYLAGLIDGEGNISIGDTRKSPRKSKGLRKPRKEYVGQINYTTQISVCNCNLEVLEWLKAKFGGLIHIAKKPGKPHWDIKKAWVMPCKPCRELLQSILPYLIIKKNQAKLMIQAREIIDANVLRMERTPEQRNHLSFLAINIKLFNKKDPSALLSPITKGVSSQSPEI